MKKVNDIKLYTCKPKVSGLQALQYTQNIRSQAFQYTQSTRVSAPHYTHNTRWSGIFIEYQAVSPSDIPKIPGFQALQYTQNIRSQAFQYTQRTRGLYRPSHIPRVPKGQAF